MGSDAARILVALALLVATIVYAVTSLAPVKCTDVQSIKAGHVVNLGGC